MSEERPNVSDHWMILRCGVGIWNRFRNDLLRVNLEGASLQGASLEGANLQGASLEGANLMGADLGRAVLLRANLQDANLEGANLVTADLVSANLEGANLQGAYLGGAGLGRANLAAANLRYAYLGGAEIAAADLRGADFAGARLNSTYLHAVDLREVKGLEAVGQTGPSAVSSQTLKKSQGQVSAEFLKGCGLEDWEILGARLHDPDLRQDEITEILYEIDRVRGESPIVPLSVFISYNRNDQRFVEKLENRLNKDRIRSWRDLKDMKAGPWEEQVDRAIGLQKTVVLVLSEESVRSKWVLAEVERAQEVREELEQRSDEPVHVLCPVALDDAWKDDKTWPRVLRMEVQRYNILDFSRWGSDEEFEKEYEKLKTGLGIYYANDAPEGS